MTKKFNEIFILLVAIFFAGLLTVMAQTPRQGERIKNEMAVFTGIDKITGRITTFNVAMNDTYQFGKLIVRPRVCYSSPIFERPNLTSFVEVDSVVIDVKTNEYGVERIFTGWMFAQSPGINGVEHAVNDVWLIDCQQEIRN